MPIDMPPPAPVYQIERAAPVRTNELMLALSNAARSVSERTQASTAEVMLPQLDMKSAALTREDRVALVSARQAALRGELASGQVASSNSYVGERIAAGVANASAQRQAARGELSQGEAKAVRCRMVGLAFDSRAWAYLQGGEKAAETARSSISPVQIAECSKSVSAARLRSAIPARVSPSVAHRSQGLPHIAAPVRIDLIAGKSAPVRVDLANAKTAAVGVNLENNRKDPVQVDLQNTKRTQANLAAQAAARASFGR